MNNKRIGAIILIVAGALAIALGCFLYTLDTGTLVSRQTYGGDAYTGIQNAAAHTANNLVDVASIIALGLGGILFFGGLALIATGIAILPNVRPADEMPLE